MRCVVDQSTLLMGGQFIEILIHQFYLKRYTTPCILSYNMLFLFYILLTRIATAGAILLK